MVEAGKRLENFTFSGGVSGRISSRTWTWAAAVCQASSASLAQILARDFRLPLVWLT